ncbi:UDP-N-acetylglucosamine--N-acetylmuramyl-(pentapeptide) pyrophosphoryl-undecaprenol N-acetylglucosamine transferase [Pseudolycoriella hygida]|uniref:DNA polymerase III subunit epsilon n=1 Tax=Pseudolycoriella hygida TaxID=35572 RepID=A0A9Q0S4A9_9DIPT|nr:UDP-N-acetylglucosamine--N-acetylmuramyl-(pentapeptide) pyrophosphoryl-undecaprenol N-acetylglucosamine transferase [Pseudolycoriella hygida]
MFIKMIYVGITGSYASGKTFLLNCLANLGFVTFSSDNYITELYQNLKIQDIILTEIIYSEDLARQRLQDFIHPLVVEKLSLLKQQNSSAEIIFAEVPLLFEVGFEQYFDFYVTTFCKEKTRLARAKSRQGFDFKNYKKITEIQLPQKIKMEKADFIINTDVEQKDLDKQIHQLIDHLIKKSKEIILDTETTGLEPRDGHRIVEIGAIEMVNKVLTGKHFHFYINPERDMPTEAYRIHGISGEFLKNKPRFKEIADDFLAFIKYSKLVIHNAAFDIKFLNYELSLLNIPTVEFLELSNTIDTLALARKMFPGSRVSLDALCKRYKIDNSARKLHGALKDAALLAEVYVELTGGRQVSFAINNNKPIEEVVVKTFTTRQKNILVIKPTKEELQKHRDFLKKILSPLWLYKGDNILNCKKQCDMIQDNDNKELSNNYIKWWWRSIDQQMIISLVILFVFSLMLVTTSGSAVANRIGLSEHYFATRQAIYLVCATILIVFFSSFSKNWLKRFSILGFITCVIMLILVKFYGYEVKGATRWINILGLSIQPSEFIKPFFVVIVGWILSLKFKEDFPSFFVCLILYSIVALLLIIQPDFGMLVMITLVGGSQLFIAGMPIFWIILATFMGAAGITGAYFFLPHVTKRINSFLDPDSSENYQVGKSIRAFEHGGLYGRGPGEGAVKQVLPDSHTDFIFAVAGEEFGAIICLIIIGIFAFIVIRSILKLIKEEDKFIQLSASGIITQLGLQAIINIGVTLNLLPTKGMTLPFISYGGSSTLATAIAIDMKKIVVTGGGTAGHLFPAITLGNELIKRGYELHLITDIRCQKYITNDLKLIPHIINVRLFSKGSINKLRLFISLLGPIFKLILLFARIKPSVIIGFGGYPTFTPLLAALFLRIPMIVYEQNCFLGKTNRFFLKYLKMLVLTYKETKNCSEIDNSKKIIIGSIVRENIKILKEKGDFNNDPFRILIFGGSQGAKIFSTLIPESVKLLMSLDPSINNFHITQQAALEDHATIEKVYKELKISYQLGDFFYDMENQYANHELVISRAGASTIAELSYIGLPAIFIPLPSAADNHQFYNANSLAESGAGWCFEQREVTPKKLAEKLLVLIKNRDILKQASSKLLQRKNDGGEVLASLVEKIIR